MLTDIEQPHGRVRFVKEMAVIGAAHHGELDQVLRLVIDVGADVEQQHTPLLGGHEGADRGPPDPLHTPEIEQG